ASMGGMRRSGKRPAREPVVARAPATPPSRFSRTRILAIAAVLVAVLAAFVAYAVAHRGMPDRLTGASNAPPASAERRFIGGADDGYADPGSCAACHREIAATYRQTGMARAFYRARPENMVEDFTKANTYFHEPSGDHYTMIRRGGQYYQRRHQLDAAGRETNVFERQIDYVMG